eukprot:6465199-Amphidinium_carterae.3
MTRWGPCKRRESCQLCGERVELGVLSILPPLCDILSQMLQWCSWFGGASAMPIAPLTRRCSVVSSSGVVMLKNQSQAIDKSDAVIHFNTAPLKGYEGWVGSRDDVRFVNNQVSLSISNAARRLHHQLAYSLDRHVAKIVQPTCVLHVHGKAANVD